MTRPDSLGLIGIEGVHYYVRDLERSRRFYVDLMDFEEFGASEPELVERGRQRSLAFRAGACVVVCSTPVGEGGRADRYLQKHPDGVGAIVFRVENARRAFELLEARGATPITDIQQHAEGGGTLQTFSITTPFGDTTFRFIERHAYPRLFPGFRPHPPSGPAHNSARFTHFDHITSNFQTLMPALLWMEHVFGLERFWDVEFHTGDAKPAQVPDGSGLRSVVMWDPSSGIKFANNEPTRPNFKASQINAFHEQHRGDGVQHLALGVSDIVHAVRALRGRGVEFMHTPAAYYAALPARMAALGIGSIAEDLNALQELEILVDGHARNSYLLQIFLKDSAGLYQSPEAGPFFYEIIERKGDAGFGAGNFRALFESIERDQAPEGHEP